MAVLSNNPHKAIAATLFIVAFVSLSLHFTDAQVGVCYGMLGDNLPTEKDVVHLYKSNGIRAMRLYSPNLATLQALQGSGIKLMLDVPNETVPSLASSDPSSAMQWVTTYVVPFASSIKYIVVGNEIHPSDKQASSVLPAMQNVLNALKQNKLGDLIKVSTSIDTTLIVNSYPPSDGQFNDTSSSYTAPIIKFLSTNKSPLLVNVYTYFAYVSNQRDISLNYALFTSPGTVVTDPNNNKNYKNLFDAMVDSVYAALAKAGAPNTAVVVSETGWPSDGGDAATVNNAGTYYRNLINHVEQGTPLRPGQAIETYLFAMFDEDKKIGANTERNFGLFTPTKHPKYGQLNFS
ncbi:glucan endo-1,3-beta-glucosidase-like [Spinacia oleracea]|uniref:Glucan endo-1,3-beta-glucosidase-like n=1 Tax=Spinacia oleracea TaxID=3562 RepID=A0A9R0JQE6_SPIOL|nr:glucan endo-1,3-beta-glucosidase-like [Spinacia oleracea]XP_056699189.1 glucan endo-1,3-beta-glucosidase-like [Spinacia oleracea]